jgi:hypothetical protein
MMSSIKKGTRSAILSALSILLLLLAVITILPYSASHLNMLGYHSLCSFVPLSTLILAGAAVVIRLVRDMDVK